MYGPIRCPAHGFFMVLLGRGVRDFLLLLGRWLTLSGRVFLSHSLLLPGPICGPYAEHTPVLKLRQVNLCTVPERGILVITISYIRTWSQVLRKYIRTLIIFLARDPDSPAPKGTPGSVFQVLSPTTDDNGQKVITF